MTLTRAMTARKKDSKAKRGRPRTTARGVSGTSRPRRRSVRGGKQAVITGSTPRSAPVHENEPAHEPVGTSARPVSMDPPPVVEDYVSSSGSPVVSSRRNSAIPADHWHSHEEYNPDEPSLTRGTPQSHRARDSLVYYRERVQATMASGSTQRHSQGRSRSTAPLGGEPRMASPPPLVCTQGARTRPRSHEPETSLGGTSLLPQESTQQPPL